MATRYYFPASGSPAVTPPTPTGWTVTTSFTTLPMSGTKTNTALANGSARSKGSTAQPSTRLDRVYVGPQIGAQTITGTFSAVFMGAESGITDGSWLDIHIKIVSSDGQTVRGTLYAGSPANASGTGTGADNGEWPKTGSDATRIKNALTLTSVTALNGDRVVIEMGWKADSSSSAGTTYLRYGDPTATSDYALTGGLTTSGTPWVELSQTLTDVSITVTNAIDAVADGAATVGSSRTAIATVAPAAKASATLAAGASSITSAVTAAGKGAVVVIGVRETQDVFAFVAKAAATLSGSRLLFFPLSAAAVAFASVFTSSDKGGSIAAAAIARSVVIPAATQRNAVFDPIRVTAFMSILSSGVYIRGTFVWTGSSLIRRQLDRWNGLELVPQTRITITTTNIT
jgi:hypothetical protein